MTDASADATPRRERLAQRRKTLGMTQEALADVLGVERTTVVRWERGETGPQPWIRPRLAKAPLVQAIGHELGTAEMLTCVAWCYALLGDYERARAFCEQSLALAAKLDGCGTEYYVWDTLGYIKYHLGDFAQAAANFESALGPCRDSGDRLSEAEILTHLGDARHDAGELSQARQAWQQALAIYEDIPHGDADKVRAKLFGTED